MVGTVSDRSNTPSSRKATTLGPAAWPMASPGTQARPTNVPAKPSLGSHCMQYLRVDWIERPLFVEEADEIVCRQIRHGQAGGGGRAADMRRQHDIRDGEQTGVNRRLAFVHVQAGRRDAPFA